MTRLCLPGLGEVYPTSKLYCWMRAAVRNKLQSIAVIALCIACGLSTATPSIVRAGDWPQILGPQRNGHAARDERLADSWDTPGPKVIWEHRVGNGYSGPVVSGGKLIIFHRQSGELLVDALDATTGKPLWQHKRKASYVSSIDRDDGPRATPVIHNGRVHLFSPEGDLFCLALDTGKEIWARELSTELETPDSYFGAGSTPIVEGDKLLVNVGARGKAGLVAFNISDGKTAWQKSDEVASYSSPIAADISGARHVIFVTRYNVVSIDPANGDIRFRFPFGKRGPTVNAAIPLLCDGELFVTASYGIGAILAHPDKTAAKTIWQSDAISSQYTSSLYQDGVLYGTDGRADQPPAHLKALDAKSGETLWTEDSFGVAHLIEADGKIIALKDDGTLTLFKPSKQKFEQLATAKILEGTTRAIPALAAGNLYARDSEILKCWSIGKK